VPVFPIMTRLVPRFRARLRIPQQQIHGEGDVTIDARYPRFLSVPGVIKPLDGFTLAASLRRLCRRLEPERFRPNVIDAHLAFPDGFAAVLLGALTDTPVTITVRGHDLNFMRQFPVRWAMTKFALRRAQRVIGVCQALVDAAVEAGAEPGRSLTVSNGVDTDLFHPTDREEARRRLGLPLDRPVVVSVGAIIERKGFHVLIDAVARIPKERRPLLAIVGGPGEEPDYRGKVDALVERLDLRDDVHFAGAVENHELRPWYNAANLSALASSREGWANVLLESMACGVPVVATDVWGTPECICRPEYGTLVPERTGEAFAHALDEALHERTWDADALVRYARENTWEAVGARHLAALEAAIEEHRAATRGRRRNLPARLLGLLHRGRNAA
jgi:glycosyltransferase involved in cell wall biosynthesis